MICAYFKRLLLSHQHIYIHIHSHKLVELYYLPSKVPPLIIYLCIQAANYDLYIINAC